MTEAIAAVLIAVVVLEVKHFLCDYPLQTLYQVKNKGKYGHPAGLIHAGFHVLGTSVVFLVLPTTLAVGAAILVGEYAIHYHIDWGKDQIMRATGYTSEDGPFWWLIGADQLLHHLTYIGIVAILVAAG